MKMSDVFEMNRDIDIDDFELFNLDEMAAAAHAINSHDKLEADKVALVEALELAESAINIYAIDLGIPDDTVGRNKIREALKQAKGDL